MYRKAKVYTLKWPKGNLILLESLERQLESSTVLNVMREPDFSSCLIFGALVHRAGFKCTSGK